MTFEEIFGITAAILLGCIVIYTIHKINTRLDQRLKNWD